jgi:hypothetical protein
MLATLSVWSAFMAHPSEQVRMIPAVLTRRSVVVTEEKRKVYPYSIGAGGARTVQEAKRAMSDPAVQFHYAAFDLKNLRQVTLTSDLVGYVSYRYGDKIFWTTKKLRLKAGETVFTDGQHIARGRCLNCYSAMPMMPTRRTEPSESTLDSPVEVPLIALAFPNLPLPVAEPRILPGPHSEVAPVIPAGTGGGGGAAGGHPGFGFFPILPIIPPIHRHHPTNNTASNVVPPPVTPSGPLPPPVTVVPEPDYVWMLIAAFLALAVLGGIKSRRAGQARARSEQ